MKKPILFLLVLSLLCSMFTGCQIVSRQNPIKEVKVETVTMVTPSTALAATPSTDLTATPSFSFDSSDPGMVTIHGYLIVSQPWVMAPADDGLFLVPLDTSSSVSTIPVFEVGKVPQAQIDEQTGEFMFVNIRPGKYALVVTPDSGSQIPASTREGNLAIITVEAADQDQTKEIGMIYFP